MLEVLSAESRLTTVFRLREVMEARNPAKSLSAVARDSRVSYQTCHKVYHNHTTRVDLATLDRLAKALGCEPGALIGKAKRGKA